MKRHRITTRDVYAVPTEGGTGYFQCCSVLNEGVALIRVLPGLYSDKPMLDELCERNGLVWLLFPLSLYLSRGDIQFVGSCMIPDVPKMMIQQKLDANTYVATFVDGSMHYAKSATITLPDEDAQVLPAYRLPNRPFLQLTMLRLNGMEPKSQSEQTLQRSVVTHFLYFIKKGDARKFVDLLERSIEKIHVELNKSDDEPRFSVIVSDSQLPLESSRLSEVLTDAAVRFKGEYDGFEMADVI